MPRKTLAGRIPLPTRRPRFNEAAARCRGKHANEAWKATRGACFNEAAARCRGKPRNAIHETPPSPRFNEAAARCRGKQAAPETHSGSSYASMRPRPDAAENCRPLDRPVDRTGLQ